MKPLTLFFVMLMALLLGGASAGEDSWHVQRTPRFLVHTPGPPSEDDRRFVDGFDAQYERIARLLGFRLEQPLPIYLYNRRDTFLRDLRGKPRERVVGIASSDGGVIRIDVTGLFVAPAEVLRHEMVHSFLFLGLGDAAHRIPLWFNEGLSQHAAEPAPWEVQTTLDRAVQEGSIVSLKQLERSFPPEREGVAYAQSQSVVEFLLKRMPPCGLHRMLADLRKGAGFEEALERASGLSTADLEREWSEQFKSMYRWEWINWLVWPGVGLIFVLAAVVARRRVAQKRQRIEEEDVLWDEELDRLPEGEDRP